MHTLNTGHPDRALTFNWQLPIDSLGTNEFSAATVTALEEFAGVEHCSAYLLDDDQIKLVASASAHGSNNDAPRMGALYISSGFWRRDPTIAWAKEVSLTGLGAGLHISPSELADDRQLKIIYPEVCDRVFVCGKRNNKWYGLSMLRTWARGTFNSDALQNIGSIAEPFLSLLAKHACLQAVLSDSSSKPSLRSVAEIERCLPSVMPTLSRRENQVCARILAGISTPGIAVDLGLREHSVTTYRKRAYRRLNIGTRFELMQRYLAGGFAEKFRSSDA